MTKRKVTDLLPSEAILISSDADLKVLEEFEKADARWNSGDKATSKKKGYFSYPVYFKNDGILGLRWTADTGEFITTYPATDFIPTDPERGLTIIKGDGSIITAQNQDGRVFDIEQIPTESDEVEVSDTVLLSEVRNKLNPIKNLIAMLENGLVKGSVEMHDLVLKEIEQCKINIEELTRNTPNQ